MKTLLNSFAERLSCERQKNRWSKRFVAASISINENTYHHYEYGECYPSLPKLCSLASCLNVSLDYLCGRTNTRRPCPFSSDIDIRPVLAENLKQLRRQLKLTQTQIAEALDVHMHTYQYYELQKRLPTCEMFLKLADFYHVSLDRLATPQSNSITPTA